MKWQGDGWKTSTHRPEGQGPVSDPALRLGWGRWWALPRGHHGQSYVIRDIPPPPGEGPPITGTGAEREGGGHCPHGHGHLPGATPTAATSASCGAALAPMSLNLPRVACGGTFVPPRAAARKQEHEQRTRPARGQPARERRGRSGKAVGVRAPVLWVRVRWGGLGPTRDLSFQPGSVLPVLRVAALPGHQAEPHGNCKSPEAGPTVAGHAVP